MNFCTAIARNYLAYARVLAESLREFHPEANVTVLLLDDPERTVESEPFEVLHVEDIGVPDLAAMLPRYGPVDLSAAVRPRLLKHLLESGANHIIYLDPDIQIFAPLGDVAESAEKHGIALVPRVSEPIPRDGERPTEQEISSDGAYDLGFIALGAGAAARSFLDWWAEGLSEVHSGEDPRALVHPDHRWRLEEEPEPLFADRRWTDLVPNLFPETKPLRDLGHDVAYWNLHTRRLEADGNGVTVNGERLGSFHFSGFLPEYPHWLSEHSTRVKLSENRVLADLCASYAARLKEHGHDGAGKASYGYGRLPNGIPYDDITRKLYNEAMDTGEDFGNVFEMEGAEKFLGWLNGPADDGGRHGITRYMRGRIYPAYLARRDVRKKFKDLSGPDGKGFVRWIMNDGRYRYDIPEQLVLDDPYGFSKASERRPKRTVDGVNVVGYLTGEMGLGEVARQNIAALQSVGVPVATRTFNHFGNRNQHEFEDIVSPEDYSTNLICLQPDELEQFRCDVGEEFFEGRRTIGVWAWELDIFPEEWFDALDLVDELWVWTSYVAQTLSRQSSKPVVTIPPPVVAADSGGAKVDIGVPEGFTFLFVFDFHSVMQRKNPHGLIEAFKRAFAPGEGPQLVIKSINGDARPRFLEQLKVAALDRDDIFVVDEYLSAKEKTALMAGCDCYVSLHRSEGFGLTPAEAMSVGKPVIATGFSGTADYMNSANSYPVDYTMVEVGEGSPPYEAHGTWAAPNLDHAAALMRRVWENPEEANAKGERARRDIEENLSLETIGKLMRARLELPSGVPAATPEAATPEAATPEAASPPSPNAGGENI